MPRPRKPGSEPAKPVVKPDVRVAFWKLAGALAARKRKPITVATVWRDTKLPKNTIYRAANGTLTELPLSIVKPLAKYFEVDISELLEEVPDDELAASPVIEPSEETPDEDDDTPDSSDV